MAAHNELGKWGEETAVRYLKRKGLYIRHRDWHCGHKDIDIVATDEYGTQVIFVEVKTRTAPVQAAPQENVGVVKQRRITAAALRYLHGSQSFGKEAFFDVISVILYPDGTEIEYFPYAWIPMYV